MASPAILSKTRKSSAFYKSSNKSPAVQSAIILKRAQNKSKRQIAKDLGISRNTVASVLDLSQTEQQIAQYRLDTLAICPDAITAVHNQVKAGDGNLGIRLLESTGVIGEDAIESVRRNSQRQAGAINVLVQSGATLHMGDTPSHHNVPLSDTATTYSNVQNNENNSTDTVNDKVTDKAGHLPGKHPKATPTHQ